MCFFLNCMDFHMDANHCFIHYTHLKHLWNSRVYSCQCFLKEYSNITIVAELTFHLAK